MKKASCEISKTDGKYKIKISDKKILKLLLPVIYPDIENTFFYITDYEGTNTYFGKQYWNDRNIRFIEHPDKNAFSFKGSGINFITHDKIDNVNIYVNNISSVNDKNYTEAFFIDKDGGLLISSVNYHVIAKCIMYLIEYNLFFLFSKNYKRDKLLTFLNSFLDPNFNGKITLFTKTLHLKNGIKFKLCLYNNKGLVNLYDICFTNNNWQYEKISEERALDKCEIGAKINYFYVSMFFSVVIVGILLIGTQLRFNIAIFVVAFLLFFSLLSLIFKKFKVIIGFKIAVKSR